MLGGCYVFYFYFYFALHSKNVKNVKPINTKLKALYTTTSVTEISMKQAMLYSEIRILVYFFITHQSKQQSKERTKDILLNKIFKLRPENNNTKVLSMKY